MTIYEFAEMLNGREYPKFITRNELEQAKSLGFAIVSGYSDDIIVINGAMCVEEDCYEGGTIYLNSNGICDKDITHLYIEAFWCKDGYSWTYESNIPHATFEIFEEGDKYCRGMVFDIKSLQIAEETDKRIEELVSENNRLRTELRGKIEYIAELNETINEKKKEIENLTSIKMENVSQYTKENPVDTSNQVNVIHNIISEAEKSFHTTGRPMLDVERYVAEMLVTKGIIIPPCVIGDTVYFKIKNKVSIGMVKNVVYDYEKNRFVVMGLTTDDELFSVVNVFRNYIDCVKSKI